jgi:membrane protein YqaA with SNARE-associated domain
MDVSFLITDWGVLGLTAATALSDSIIPVPAWPAIGLAIKYWNPVIVFFAALAGSMIGMTTNYIIGYKGIHHWLVRRNPKSEKRAQKWFDRWGPMALLTLTWIPFLGDPLTIAAGALQMPFRKFFTYILAAKIWTIAAIILVADFLLGAVGWL